MAFTDLEIAEHTLTLERHFWARRRPPLHLRKRLSSLGAELTLLLPADDSRWHVFGMTPPAERRAARKTARNTAADGAPAPRIEAVASRPS